MNSIILDPGVKDILIDDAKDFLQSKPWYAERGIPFRRGYLLVRVLCLPIYVFELTTLSTALLGRAKHPSYTLSLGNSD
jgi:hypothetical protein